MLGRSTPQTMDLAAFRLDQVQQVKPGLFRYGGGLRAALVGLFAGSPPPDDVPPPPEPPQPRRRPRRTQPKVN